MAATRRFEGEVPRLGACVKLSDQFNHLALKAWWGEEKSTIVGSVDLLLGYPSLATTMHLLFISILLFWCYFERASVTIGTRTKFILLRCAR